MAPPRRLLTLGHSYVVAQNRRLARELAREGAGRWEITVGSPDFVHGDLRPIHLEPTPGDACHIVSFPAYLTKRPHVMAYGRAARRLVSQTWDLVHAWEEPYVFAGFQISRWVRDRVPFVFSTLQNISKRYPPPFCWFERSCLRRSSGWLACGQTVTTTLCQRGYAGKPHRVIPLGVDTDDFRTDARARDAIRRELGWSPAGPPVVGYLGRFTPEKGLAVLTAALEAVDVPWRALFVGGGLLESELRAWASRFPDRVRIVTGVIHDAVPRYLNAMDVLTAPSQTTPRWKEQLGRMLIEAMACSVPVVGSDSGEIPHVIADAGIVVPEANVPAWAAAITALLNNPRRRAELGEAGRARAEAHYAWSVVARQHLSFFDELLESAPLS